MSKKITPEDITKIIQPGSRIFIGTGCSEPTVLTLPDNKFFDSHEPSLFRHQALFAGKSIRQAVNGLYPISLSGIPRLFSKPAGCGRMSRCCR